MVGQTQVQPISTIVATTERLLSDAWGSNIIVSKNIIDLRPDVGYSSVYRFSLQEKSAGEPTCWCVNRLPEPIVQRMEQTYRTELAKACPEANDEMLFSRGVAAACAYWALRDCRWRLVRALNEDWDVAGMATSRQRLLFRIAVAAETIEQVGYLEALGATLQEISKRLRTLWPPEAHTMPYYPAFRS